MAEFTREELIRRARFNVMRKGLSKNDQGVAIDARLAEIALAALTAELVAYISQSNLDALSRGHDAMVKYTDNVARPVLLYRLPEIE